jgi:hypothetical protein
MSLERHPVLTVCLWSALLFLPACGQQGARSADERGPSDEVEVVDAMTLRIGEELVQLADVSAPRSAPRARCWAEALLAREAMEVLDAETTLVRDIEIEPRGEGRSRVTVHGRDLSRLLVDQGLAAPTGLGWDWCGPMILDTPRAPRLGYDVRPPDAPAGQSTPPDGGEAVE